MPIDPNALALYQRDAIAALRSFAVDVEALETAILAVLSGRAAKLEDVAHTGHELASYAYDDNGDLLNPDAEDMVTAIDNGVVPDIEDAREGALEPVRKLLADLRSSLANLEGISVPADAMARGASSDRVAVAAARRRERRRRSSSR